MERREGAYLASDRPGCLAPHLWLVPGRSLYDLFGTGLTLLGRFDAKQGVIDQAVAQADAAGVPLTVLHLPREREAEARYTRALTLVRPDQHIAWRGETLTPGTIARVTGR